MITSPRIPSLSLHHELWRLVPPVGGQYDWGQCLALIPELRALEHTPQDLIHHAEGNVGVHTRMVLDALLDDVYVQQASPERRFVLFMAALLHDISKPETTRIDEPTGRISQPGHSRKGAIRVRQLLWQAQTPFIWREAICRLIAVHQVPFFAFHTRNGDTPERVARTLSWQLHLPELLALARADIRGRVAKDSPRILQDMELFQTLAEEEGCWIHPKSTASAHTRVVYARGQELHLDTPLFQRSGSTVWVMSGLPASGKNTWVAQHLPDLPVVSFDDAKAELGLRHGQNDGMAAHFAIDKAKSFLREHAPFVWNATHLSEQMRFKTLDLLFAYHASVRVVYVEAQPTDVWRRNTQRDTSLRNTDIEQMQHRWEVPLPVEAHQVSYVYSHAKGFDVLTDGIDLNTP